MQTRATDFHRVARGELFRPQFYGRLGAGLGEGLGVAAGVGLAEIGRAHV